MTAGHPLRKTRTFQVIAVFLAISLAGRAMAGEAGTSPEELKTLVKEYAFRQNAKLNPTTEFKIEEYPIADVKTLHVQVFLASYLSPDGSKFNERLFICHAGKLTPFAESFGGHGLMSAVVSGGKLYYTYSFGSGRHRSHLGQLTIVNGQAVVAQSGALLDNDLFVKKVGDSIQLEKGTFEKFDGWKEGKSIGTVSARESGFAVVNEAGKEIDTLAGKLVEPKSSKR